MTRKNYLRKAPGKYSQSTIDSIIKLLCENKTTKFISLELNIPKPIINYYRLKQKWLQQTTLD